MRTADLAPVIADLRVSEVPSDAVTLLSSVREHSYSTGRLLERGPRQKRERSGLITL